MKLLGRSDSLRLELSIRLFTGQDEALIVARFMVGWTISRKIIKRNSGGSLLKDIVVVDVVSELMWWVDRMGWKVGMVGGRAR
jgi:hypothetical protein